MDSPKCIKEKLLIKVIPYDPQYKTKLKIANLSLVVDSGYNPTHITDYHYRIEVKGVIVDFYPSTEKWLNISRSHTKVYFGVNNMLRFLNKLNQKDELPICVCQLPINE